jgi:RHS repeat-associated protein
MSGGQNDSRLRSIVYPNGRIVDYDFSPSQEPVTALTSSGTTATVTTAAAHGLSIGDTIVIDGAGAPYDGTFTVTSVGSSTTFTYTLSASYTGSPSGSDITEAKQSLDNMISRMDGIQDHGGSAAGTVLEGYTYLGLDTIVQRTRGNSINLSYIDPGSGDPTTTTPGGDRYTGLDQFGRVDDQLWGSASSPTDRFQYGYDSDSNPLYKKNVVSSSNSELYHADSTTSGDDNSAYDSLNRLTDFQVGTLSTPANNGPDSPDQATGPTTAHWSLDALGNWSDHWNTASASDALAVPSLGTAQNSNATGWYGLEITIGSSDVLVASLGRYKKSGNTGTHDVKLVDATTGSDVAGTTVTVNMTSVGFGQFAYASLDNPVKLLAGHSYYLVSHETNGGDQWYSDDSSINDFGVTPTDSVYNSGSGWTVGSASGHTFGPVGLKIVTPGASSATYNSRNQRTDLGSYDNNGNLVGGDSRTYDAWNRWVGDGSNSTNYLANGFLAGSTDSDGATIDTYYSADWQVLEDQLHHFGGGLFSTKDQYIWGAGSLDNLVLRDDNSSSGNLGVSGSFLGERLYAEQDANGSVTAITNTSGTVVERFQYDPFGQVKTLNASWSPTTDTKRWIYLFQGMRASIGIEQNGAGSVDVYYDRNRYYLPGWGRFLTPDPTGYSDGMNLYQPFQDNPMVFADPLGLFGISSEGHSSVADWGGYIGTEGLQFSTNIFGKVSFGISINFV